MLSPDLEDVVARELAVVGGVAHLWKITTRIFQAAWELGRSGKEEDQLSFEILPLLLTPEAGKQAGWGTYFGPRFTRIQTDGSALHVPELHHISTEAPRLWEARLTSLTHPLLRARFADAIWDLGNALTPGRGRDSRHAYLALDEYLRAAKENGYPFPADAKRGLSRALALAASFGKTYRVEEAAEAMIAISTGAEQEDISSWTVAYEGTKGQKMVPPRLLSRIIEDLESRLQAAAKCASLAQAEAAAIRLVAYYRTSGQAEEKARVLRSLVDISVPDTRNQTSAIAVYRLKPIIDLLEKERAPNLASELRRELELRALGVSDEMISEEVSFQIDSQAIREHLLALINIESPFVALFKVAIYLTPNPADLKERMHRMAEEFPFASIFSSQIHNDEGIPVATIGTLTSDPEGKLVEQAMRDIRFNSIFMSQGLALVEEKFEVRLTGLTEFIFQCPLFLTCRRKFFDIAFAAIQGERYAEAIHVLIPQIENVFRELLRMLKTSRTKTSRSGEIEYKSISDVLSEDIVVESLEEGHLLFFKTVFVDRRGINLRNLVMHGLAPIEGFNRDTAMLLLQAILLLSAFSPEFCYTAQDADTPDQN